MAAGRAVCLVLCLCLLPAAGTARAAAAPEKPVLAVLGFESAFDDGKAGGFVANAILKKLQRTFRYVTVDAMSTADALAAAGFKVTLDAPAAAVRKMATEALGAQIVIWGRVERKGDGFVIQLRQWDLRQPGDKPQVALTEQSDDAHGLSLACGRLADALTPAAVQMRREAAAVVPEDKRENLLANGDFERGKGSPEAWQRIDSLTTFWSGDGHPGKCLRVDTDVYETEVLAWRKRLADGADIARAPAKTVTKGNKYDTIAGTYGVHFPSDPVPVEPGVTYRVSVDVKGRSSGIFFPKLFIKGYTRYKKGEFAAQDREAWRAYVSCRTETDGREWEHFTRTITPNPHVCVYDFESAGDGAVGRDAAAALRAALTEGGYALLPYEAQQEAVRKAGFALRFDMPLPELLRFTTDSLHAVTAVWGRIETGDAGAALRVRVSSIRQKRSIPLLDLKLPYADAAQAKKAHADVVAALREAVRVVEYVRIIPYSYWPPGVFCWDNIRLTVEDRLPRTGAEDDAPDAPPPAVPPHKN